MLIRGEDSAINLRSTLTEEEKWHYDLFGYLVLRQVVSPAEVERMLEIADGTRGTREGGGIMRCILG